MPSGKEIKSTQRNERRVLVELDAALTTIVKGAQHATIVRNGAGDVTVTFERPFARPPIGFVHGRAANVTGYTETETVSTLELRVTDLAGALADGACALEIVGWDSVDEI